MQTGSRGDQRRPHADLQQVRAALDHLPMILGEVLLLCHVEYMSYMEIANRGRCLSVR